CYSPRVSKGRNSPPFALNRIYNLIFLWRLAWEEHLRNMLIDICRKARERTIAGAASRAAALVL
ncbi:MAG: hypothetical protein ACRD51_17225, partial [Candidatus Acidiferrum sp.]